MDLARIQDGDWGGRWNRWDTVIAAWLASVLLAAAFSGTTHSEWRGCRDAARYMAVLWVLTRSNYDENAWKLIYGALIVSVMVAVVWGLAALAWPHEYLGVELNSVGHVNDSMTYVAICFGVVLATLAIYWNALPGLARVWMIVGAGAMLVAVAIAGSRAAAVSVMALALCFGALWLGRSRVLVRFALVGVVVYAVAIVGLNTDMWRKQEMLAETSHPVLDLGIRSGTRRCWNAHAPLLAWATAIFRSCAMTRRSNGWRPGESPTATRFMPREPSRAQSVSQYARRTRADRLRVPPRTAGGICDKSIAQYPSSA